MSEQTPHVDEAARRRGIYKTLIILLAVVVTIIAYVIFQATRAPALDREQMRTQGTVVFDQPRIFSDVELVDHRGETVTKDDLKGQWSLLFFGFTNCPDICPMTLADLGRLLRALPEDIADETRAMLVSLDPERDTPEQLAEYVDYFHPEMIGLTGEFLQLRRFANEVNVAFSKVTLDEEDYTIDHGGQIVIINPKGDYHGFFRPPFEHEQLLSHYTTIFRAFSH